MRDIVIVGASIAGFSAAAELRAQGHDGAIHLVGEEPVRTYERPPLSKGVLGGEDPTTTEWAAARDDDLDLDWLVGERAVGLDVGGRTVELATGESLPYDGLVIATGASPRRLPGHRDRAGLHLLRSLDDCLGLRADLDAGPERVVVVGAGFIGGEVAATCRLRGHEVTVVEPLSQPLERVLGPTIGAAVADVHRAAGVDLRLGTGVDAVLGDDHVEGVRTTDGAVIEADLVVVGIGVVPNTAWLDGSGLAVEDGIRCDATTLVAPGITAAGDVASWDSPRYGRLRIEHWDNAVDMGRAAGRRLLASDEGAEVYDPVPWFWSDQHDVRVQVAGRPTLPDQGGDLVVVDGAIGDDRFVALYGRDGQVTGALGWNWPAKTVRYRMALEQGLGWDEAISAASP
ncbi:FAD-dependent oxidoreductase [Acidimicrobiia bacterium EGI L10123]|uniref:NAD(P)/FAD-dependent oxidoreductase n=1 Tax=Salinilacustrithrix flava TaxID=2957203 RepID=UPI003D7C2576|nr:FAD-dependent oxidoreductase [Acidimicrobiia bacterium EGI L10123]